MIHSTAVKEQALALMATGSTASQVARELKLPVSTLYQWRGITNTTNKECLALRDENKTRFFHEAWDNIWMAQEAIRQRLLIATEAGEILLSSIAELRTMSQRDSVDAKELSEKIDYISKQIAALTDIPLSQITTCLGILYDKQALSMGDSTENIRVQATYEDMVRDIRGG